MNEWLNRDPIVRLGWRSARGLGGSAWSNGLLSHFLEPKAGLNLYRFCGNEPVSFWDLHGLSKCTDKCDREGRDRQREIDRIANPTAVCMGIGGTVAGGAISRSGRVAALAGAVNLVGWWLIIEVPGTVGNAYGYSACYLGCLSVEF